MDLSAYFPPESERPLDRIPPNGGMCAIFRRIGCIGDSLSAGEFVSRNPDGSKRYDDFYEHAWPAYLGRLTGSQVFSFAAGGMTAKYYCEEFAAQRGFWDPKMRCHAYILALGVNDLYHERQEIGSISDIDPIDWRRSRKTFAGYYGQIIQRLKALQPQAKFFLMTMPHDHRDAAAPEYGDRHAALLMEMTGLFSNTYLLDFRRYAPPYDARFREKFFLDGHMNACGYLLTAQMVAAYIDYLIRHHMQDFREAGLIGTSLSFDACAAP